MAHELSHVVLRHGTAQASKAQPYEIGALAGAIIGAAIASHPGYYAYEAYDAPPPVACDGYWARRRWVEYFTLSSGNRRSFNRRAASPGVRQSSGWKRPAPA